MKAIRTGATPSTLDALTLTDLPDPDAPGPGEITVAIKASSLNFHDFAVVTGMIPSAQGRIPMSDGAGEVLAVGEGVTGLSHGDAVVSLFFPEWEAGPPEPSRMGKVPGDAVDGYACQTVTAPASWFTRAPTGWSPAEAATLTCAGLTAWRALFVDTQIKPGDTVLVLGSGGVSVFALQFAKAAGARVIATSSSDEKLDRLRGLGADATVNYKEVPAWGPKVLELTGGRGVDTVVEIGGAGSLDQSMLATRLGGHVAVIGVLTGMSAPVNTALLFSRNLRVQGLTVGSRAMQLDMIAAVEANGIRPVISDTFELADLANAFRHQAANRHFGKIAVAI
ncbi:zinc-dependent alcohol dehydrogenase family protein [Tsuneonella sp. HG249]